MQHITKNRECIALNEMSHEHVINTIRLYFKHPDYSRRVLAIPYIVELLARAKLQQDVEEEMALHPCDLGSYSVYGIDE